MSKFDEQQHIEEFTPDVTDDEREELRDNFVNFDPHVQEILSIYPIIRYMTILKAEPEPEPEPEPNWFNRFFKK